MGIRESFLDGFKQAFAIPGSSVPLSEKESALVDAVSREIVRRRLTTPALAFLEMSRPLNYLGAQGLHFFQPFIAALTDSTGPQEFALFLERSDAIEVLSSRLEELEREETLRERRENEPAT